MRGHAAHSWRECIKSTPLPSGPLRSMQPGESSLLGGKKYSRQRVLPSSPVKVLCTALQWPSWGCISHGRINVEPAWELGVHLHRLLPLELFTTPTTDGQARYRHNVFHSSPRPVARLGVGPPPRIGTRRRCRRGAGAQRCRPGTGCPGTARRTGECPRGRTPQCAPARAPSSPR